MPDHRFDGESEPIANDPILRGVDLALDRLVQRDCFTQRTLHVLDELRAEVVAESSSSEAEHTVACNAIWFDFGGCSCGAEPRPKSGDSR